MTLPPSLSPLTVEERQALKAKAEAAAERVTQPIRCTCGELQERSLSAGYADGCEIHGDVPKRESPTIGVESSVVLRLLGEIERLEEESRIALALCDDARADLEFMEKQRTFPAVVIPDATMPVYQCDCLPTDQNGRPTDDHNEAVYCTRSVVLAEDAKAALAHVQEAEQKWSIAKDYLPEPVLRQLERQPPLSTGVLDDVLPPPPVPREGEQR